MQSSSADRVDAGGYVVSLVLRHDDGDATLEVLSTHATYEEAVEAARRDEALARLAHWHAGCDAPEFDAAQDTARHGRVCHAGDVYVRVDAAAHFNSIH